ncbi:MAG: glycosyltransferase family 87 protein [Phenylobacterium sp.]|uniref:glycosyltransferase family 87 protein n=1 Tax=Phenylobacterium sp. TaxID=1871053 RepID=UPI00273267D8|nr:glycosyltransferase family 87 protein [Phenylobacterium sp.]MDP3173929.1 glycosyltransferase family 87 protein [Phenylobacterium sp.]
MAGLALLDAAGATMVASAKAHAQAGGLMQLFGRAQDQAVAKGDHEIAPLSRIHRATILLSLAIALFVDCAFVTAIVRDLPELEVDFTVFWTAARMPLNAVYDVVAITKAQAWAVSDPTVLRPFPYPPTFLLFLQPLRAASLLPAYLTWIAISASLYCVAARSLIGRAWPLVLASPATVVALLTGQVTLVIAAGLILALIWLESRPRLAGMVFGLLAAAKPQILVMVPLALLAGGHLKALFTAGLVGFSLCLVSLAEHGPQTWASWFAALTGFSKIVDSRPWIGITPKAIARLAGLGGPAQIGVMAAGAALGAWLVVAAFRRTSDPVERLLALMSGYYLATPYALMYELALVQPAAVALMVGRSSALSRLAGVFAFTAVTRPLAVVMLVACRLPLWFRPAGATDRAKVD